MNKKKKNSKTGVRNKKHYTGGPSKKKNVFNPHSRSASADEKVGYNTPAERAGSSPPRLALRVGAGCGETGFGSPRRIAPKVIPLIAGLKKLQSEFITSTSHQFRTPLSTLQSSVDLLELYIEKENTARQIEILSKIKRSINYLTDTVDRITALYKFGSSKEKLKLKKINLRKFINDILDEVAVNISSTHYVNVNIESGLNTIKCNEFILKQILLNIINNAIKFSPQGGQIQMDIKTEKKFVEFTIRDEGVGIDKADLKNLFQPFFRGKNVSTIPGAGLGLAIVKRLGQIHKARIRCASEVNKGTQFSVSILR